MRNFRLKPASQSSTAGEPSARSADRWLFYAYLALIPWLPLPVGSYSPWASSIMEVWIFLLAAFWLWGYVRGRFQITTVFRKAWPAHALFLLWLAYLLLQVMPLPAAWVEAISPQAARMHGIANYAAEADRSRSTSQAQGSEATGEADSSPFTVHGSRFTAEGKPFTAEATGLEPRASSLEPRTSILKPRPSTLSISPFRTLTGWLKSLAYVLLFALTLLLVRRRSRVRQFAYVLVFSGLFQAVYGSLMTLSGVEWGFFVEKHKYLGVATGTFWNRNHLAGYLEMTLAVGIGLLIADLKTWGDINWRQRLRNVVRLLLSPKMRLRVYLVAMVIALVLTHSRMGNTAFFASLFIAGGIGLALSKRATRATVILLASLIIIDVFVVGAWFGLDKVVERLEGTKIERVEQGTAEEDKYQEFSALTRGYRLTRESRDEVGIYTLALTRDFLWTGVGLGNFKYIFPAYEQEDFGGFYRHAHNDYLEFASEVGLVGLAIIGTPVALALGAALMAQFRRRDPLMRGMSFAAIMSITALLIHSTVDFNLQIPANAATFMLLLALGWISLHLREQGLPGTGRPSRL